MSNKEIRDLILNNRSIRKQILLTPVDHEHLKIVSDYTGLSQNEIINKALNAYLSRYKKHFEERDKELKELVQNGNTHAKILEPVRIEGSSMLEEPEEE